MRSRHLSQLLAQPRGFSTSRILASPPAITAAGDRMPRLNLASQVCKRNSHPQRRFSIFLQPCLLIPSAYLPEIKKIPVLASFHGCVPVSELPIPSPPCPFSLVSCSGDVRRLLGGCRMSECLGLVRSSKANHPTSLSLLWGAAITESD